MAIHPKLERFRDRKYIKKLSKVLTRLEKDLSSVQCVDPSVELVEEADSRSFGEKLLQLRHEYHCDRVMYVRGNAVGHDFGVLVPMHQHQLFPYTVEIDLNIAAQGFAAYEQGFAKKRWITEPKDDDLERGLQALKLPKIKWSFSDRGLNHNIGTAFQIGPRQDDSDLGSWCIHSGFFPASFFGGHFPRVACFLEAIPRLERFLASKWQ